MEIIFEPQTAHLTIISVNDCRSDPDGCLYEHKTPTVSLFVNIQGSSPLSLCTLQLKTSLLIDPVATAARLPLPPHLLRIIPPGWKIPVTRRDIAKTLFPSMMLSLRATLIPSRLDCKYGVIERSPSPPSIEKNRIEKVIEQRSECVASTFVTLALERKSRIRLEQALYIVKFNLNLQDR